MDDFYQAHGDRCYALQYQADVRTRLEQFARIRREQMLEYEQAVADNHGTAPAYHHFEPLRPWNAVFALVVNDKYNGKWWSKELERPALLLLATPVKMSEVLGGDANISSTIPASSPPGLDVYRVSLPDPTGWTARGERDLGP